MPVPAFARLLIVPAVVLTALGGALGWWLSDTTPSQAGGAPQTHTIAVGDTWFCAAAFQGGVCETAVDLGDTVVWDFTGATATHSTTECGASCDTPAMMPVWDSGFVSPASSSRTFQHSFDVAGVYLYRCQVHPTLMRGRIVVGGNPPTPPGPTDPGDVNCNEATDAIDAALILQLSAGLVDDLSCIQNGDVNGDGHVDAIDAALVLQFVAGLLDTLPP